MQKRKEKCPKCGHEIGCWSFSHNNVWKISICSKCETRTSHFYYHVHLISTLRYRITKIYNKIRLAICRKNGLCFEPGCKKTPETYQIEEEKFLLCFDHAKDWGFCASCGEFYGGCEDFDFNKSKYFCSNCMDEFNHDCGLDEDGLDDEFGDEYHSEPDFELSNEEAGEI